MNEPDDLDEILAVLRSPAQPGEMIGESETMNAMSTTFLAAAPAPPKGPLTMFTSRNVFSSRRSCVAALVAFGVVGLGGVAAASPGGLPIPLLDRSVTTTTTEPDDDPAQEFDDDSNDVDDDPAQEINDDSNECDDDPAQEINDDSNECDNDPARETRNDSNDVNDDPTREIDND